jgi:hypothetical protein
LSRQYVHFFEKAWRFLKNHEIHLYNNNKKVNFNTKTWGNININEGINIDWSSINKIMNKNFHIQTFLGTIDSFRCKELYIQIVKKFKLAKRIN